MDMTGSINKNSFNGNTERTFQINGILKGRINSNIFSQNSFFLNATDNEPVIVSNNYFLYGWNISSNQHLCVFNNTFYKSGVNIYNSSYKSIIKNNIFANSNNAIYEEGELTLQIAHNNFYNTTNILHRNNQGMGTDSFFIEMLLPDTFISNKDTETGIIGEDLVTGIWTENLFYDIENNITIFTDSNKNWENNKWIVAMINVSNSETTRLHYLIIGNTAKQIKVKGNVVSSNIGQQDHLYSIDDYRLLAVSQNVDAGTTTNIVNDFEEQWRPQGGYFDIGADEFFKGEMIPGIAHVDPPAQNISTKARFNLVDTDLFPYGRV